MAASALIAEDTRAASLALGLPMPSPTPAAEQWLAALPTAVGCARRFVCDVLERWQMHSAIPAADRAVANLVADAVRTTGFDVQRPEPIELIRLDLKLIKVMVCYTNNRLLIEVWDTDSTPPAQIARERHQEKARSRTHYVPDVGGKVVRVELIDIQPETHDTQRLPLPRRNRRPPPTMPAEDSDRPTWAETDPVVLQKILDGLRGLGTGDPPA